MGSEYHESPQSVGEKIGGEIGKEVGSAIGKEVENHFHEKKAERKKKKEKGPMARRVGYAIGIVFAFLGLWVINNFQEWGWRFITDEWSQVDQIVHYSIYLSLMVYGAFILYDQKRFYYAGRLAMDGFGIYVGVRMYQVFPFDFQYLFGGWDWLNAVFPWVIIIGIIGGVIAIVVRTAKLLAGKNIYD